MRHHVAASSLAFACCDALVQAAARSRLTIRAERINAFDDPALVGPRPVYGAAGGIFGTIVGVMGFPRTRQLQARVEW